MSAMVCILAPRQMAACAPIPLPAHWLGVIWLISVGLCGPPCPRDLLYSQTALHVYAYANNSNVTESHAHNTAVTLINNDTAPHKQICLETCWP